jgi:mRNA interferase YafQ
MRTIERTNAFKRDYKREKKGQLGSKLNSLLEDPIDLLRADAPLPAKYKDHPLSGEWIDCRDCHIRPDLILIYRKIGEDVLQLVRLGSHSELGF